MIVPITEHRPFLVLVSARGKNVGLSVASKACYIVFGNQAGNKGGRCLSEEIEHSLNIQ